jgi:23S rRNA pseudouridine1911/1915/1917 synthase
VLYEDEHILAVDKPAGLVVHPSPGHDSGTLVNALLHHVRDLSGIGGELRPGIVHRLDRDTTGVLLVAKTDRAHASLSRQMKKRTLRKEYLALVAGFPRVRKGEVAFPVGRDPRDRKKMKAFRNSEIAPAVAREARTLYEIEREWPESRMALLRCRLVTGRTHQIRVHLAAIDLPVSGDRTYGIEGDLGLERQFLHAARLAFPHPFTGEGVEAESPLPGDLQAALEEARS